MIVVDVETTGIYHKKNSIISIGAVDFFNPENFFYKECRIWDNAEIMPESLKINGFTIEQIKDPNKMSLAGAVRDFLSWANKCDDTTLAGHNPVFDILFLKDSAQRYKLEWNLGREGIGRSIDLHTLCYSNHLKRGLNPPLKNDRTDLNLNKVLCYVGLFDEPYPHNALTGAKLEAEAFSRLIYGKNLIKEFKNYPVPNFLLI